MDTPASGFGLSTLVDVDSDVVLGDSLLSAVELESLARAKSPLVSLRGE